MLVDDEWDVVRSKAAFSHGLKGDVVLILDLCHIAKTEIAKIVLLEIECRLLSSRRKNGLALFNISNLTVLPDYKAILSIVEGEDVVSLGNGLSFEMTRFVPHSAVFTTFRFLDEEHACSVCGVSLDLNPNALLVRPSSVDSESFSTHTMVGSVD